MLRSGQEDHSLHVLQTHPRLLSGRHSLVWESSQRLGSKHSVCPNCRRRLGTAERTAAAAGGAPAGTRAAAAGCPGRRRSRCLLGGSCGRGRRLSNRCGGGHGRGNWRSCSCRHHTAGMVPLGRSWRGRLGRSCGGCRSRRGDWGCSGSMLCAGSCGQGLSVATAVAGLGCGLCCRVGCRRCPSSTHLRCVGRRCACWHDARGMVPLGCRWGRLGAVAAAVAAACLGMARRICRLSAIAAAAAWLSTGGCCRCCRCLRISCCRCCPVLSCLLQLYAF